MNILSNQMTKTNMEIQIMLYLIVGVIVVNLLLYYLPLAVGTFTIAKRRGVKAYGLAWVPVLNVWVFGGIADQYDVRSNKKDHKFRAVLLCFVLIYYALAVWYGVELVRMARFLDENPGVTSANVMQAAGTFVRIYLVLILLALTSVVYAACFHISLYKLLESCKPESSLALLLIACVVPFAYPFVVLSCRKYDDGVNVKLCGADRMLLEAEKQEDFSEPQGE